MKYGLKVFALASALCGFLAMPAIAGPGAGYTSVNEDVDGTGHCQNGNPNVNCNIYDGKEFVWMNGGPSGAALNDGSYFFAVLAPSGQADPNDGTVDLLSTDLHMARTFTVSGGVVGYSGPHEFDSASGKIRLVPYADTPNPGGVYILAICSLAEGYPVDPSNCKYDAFKVKSTVCDPETDSECCDPETEECEPPPPPSGDVVVHKFCDANANGLFEPAEVSLSGWDISSVPAGCSGTTDASGIVVCSNIATGSYAISETLKPDFDHTATCVDGLCGHCSVTTTTACAGDSDCPAGEQCNPEPVNPASVEVTDGSFSTVDFGNIDRGAISGQKLDYKTQSGLAGIKVLLTHTGDAEVIGCQVTDGNGNYSFGGLVAGDYTVSEVAPAGSKPIGATSCQQVLSLDDTCKVSDAECGDFVNACLGAGGGHTLGFWSNKNGQKITDNTADRAFLSALNLRDGKGNNFDPTNYTSFRNWILSATATNMAYMLSAQLAAMELNVRHAFVAGGAQVFAGTAPASCSVPVDGNGFISVDALMSAANTSLGSNGNTTAQSPARTCQELMKNALDAANNNQNFLVQCEVDTTTTCDTEGTN